MAIKRTRTCEGRALIRASAVARLSDMSCETTSPILRRAAPNVARTVPERNLALPNAGTLAFKARTSRVLRPHW